MKIKDLENKYKDNEFCFVIGSGPSLHFISKELLEIISKHPVICVNAAIMKFADKKNDLYFLSDDEDICRWSFFYDDLLKSNATCLFYDKKLKGLTGLIPEERTIFFQHKTWYNHITKEKPKDGLVMTKDANLPVIGARNSLASAVHFAYIFGVKNIILLGVDCCYDGNKKYFWEYDDEKKAKRITNKPAVFFPKRKMNDTIVDTSMIDFMKYWSELAYQAEKQKISIVNCSGGILEVFPRVDLKEFLTTHL